MILGEWKEKYNVSINLNWSIHQIVSSPGWSQLFGPLKPLKTGDGEGGGGGGEDDQQSLIQGDSVSRSNPFTLLNFFFVTELRYPFHILSIDKNYPFK